MIVKEKYLLLALFSSPLKGFFGHFLGINSHLRLLFSLFALGHVRTDPSNHIVKASGYHSEITHRIG